MLVVRHRVRNQIVEVRLSGKMKSVVHPCERATRSSVRVATSKLLAGARKVRGIILKC